MIFYAVFLQILVSSPAVVKNRGQSDYLILICFGKIPHNAIDRLLDDSEHSGIGFVLGYDFSSVASCAVSDSPSFCIGICLESESFMACDELS